MPEQLRVDQVAAGGDGIARDAGGRVVFIPGALPGEVVCVEWTQRRKDYARARVSEVVEAAPGRVEPSCPEVAHGCGGCGWQHVAPTTQLELKVEIVRDALRRLGHVADADVRAGTAVSSRGYRTTVRMAGTEDGRLGFRAAASHRVVPIARCEVAHPGLAEMIATACIPPGFEIVLRVGVASGERASLVVWPGDDAATGTGLWRGTNLPDDVGSGQDSIVHEVVVGHRLRLSTASFFQSSPQAAEALVDAVTVAIGSDRSDRFVDLYAGVGLFAATVAPRLGARQITAVEISEHACADAEVNLSGLPAQVVRADVGKWQPHPADVVVADPARSGLGPAGVATVVGTKASVVILVSCDAAALGRDTRLLTESGYRHAGSTVIDAFPMTPHVEVVTRFERAG